MAPQDLKRTLRAFNLINLKIQLEIDNYVIMHYVRVACERKVINTNSSRRKMIRLLEEQERKMIIIT